MSWSSKVQNEFVIVTGDGKEYKPLWIPSTKTIDYNIAEFNFPELSGTLVQRGTPRGKRYDMVIYFQGDDHLETCEAFEASAEDSRYWTITHPLYGRIIVAPVGLQIDHSQYNITKITGTLIETITDDSPKTSIAPKDKIVSDMENVNDTFANAFANDVEVSTQDINNLSANNSDIYNKARQRIKLTANAEVYFNLFNTANAAIVNATSEPLAAIRALQAVISYPSLLIDSVTNRLSMLVDQFNALRTSLVNISSRSAKRTYENNAGTLITAMTNAAATPQEGDYANRSEVASVIETIVNIQEQYLADLDALQSVNGGSVDSFIPDAESQIALNSLLNYTLANLFNIALESKQERTLILGQDSNAIILAHRFYGLKEDDSTLETFIKSNNIGLNEVLQIPKGRKIIYYV